MKTIKTNISFVVIFIVFLFSGAIEAQECITHKKIQYIKKQKITTTLTNGIYTVTSEPSSINLPLNSIWSPLASLGGEILNNQFIATFKPGVTEIQKAVVRKKLKAIILEKIMIPDYNIELELWYCDFKSLPGISLETKKAIAASDPDIEGLDFNYVTTPDPVSLNIQGNASAIYGNPSSVRVALIDIGIDEYHPMIRDNILSNNGYDMANQDIEPNDIYSAHGTHAASNILHFSDYKVNLINLKVFEYGSVSNSLFYAASATYVAACKGAQVINMSWGWVGSPAKCLEDAIKFAGDKNCALVVCSAGNDALNLDEDRHYPSDYELDNIISVTALENDGSYTPYANHGSEVDVAINGEFLGALPKGLTGVMQGTSVSAASVSGIAGQLYANNPNTGYNEVKSLIKSFTSTISNCPYSSGCDIGLLPSSINSISGSTLLNCSPPPKGNKRLDTRNEAFDFSYLNNTVEIRYNVLLESKVEVLVADVTGRVLHSRANYLEAGFHQQTINLIDQPEGIYFVSMFINGKHIVKKIIR